MRLSDHEIRDITLLLEQGKSLPDQYRFLLFEEKREVELIWNGKTNEITNVVLPFQTIEQVDEPRAEKEMRLQPDLFDTATGRQLRGWTNKLIWGDNKLILSSLKNGPLREEIEQQGGIKLIYIDSTSGRIFRWILKSATTRSRSSPQGRLPINFAHTFDFRRAINCKKIRVAGPCSACSQLHQVCSQLHSSPSG